MPDIMSYIKRPVKLIRFAKNHHLLDPLPDGLYLKLIFREKMGYPLNLKDPKTFSEKLQYLKLHDRKFRYTKMVDKAAAKKYVKTRVPELHIIPTFGVWDHFDDIPFDDLPDQFVLKCTHDSGNVVICRSKAAFDKENAKRMLENALAHNYYRGGREWPYKNVPRRILAEQYMEDEESCQNGQLSDYKFYCFHGVPKFLYYSTGMEDHKTARITFLDMNWNKTPFQRSDYLNHADSELPEKPKEFDELVRIASKLSEGIPFLRVDLYVLKDGIYFSELTFSPCSGMMRFEPEIYDKVLGHFLHVGTEREEEF